MGNPLQDRRAPLELAASGQVIEISNKISYFQGLAEIVEADLGALDPDKLPPGWRDAIVVGRLSFGFVAAHGQVATLMGQVAVTIHAVCQRCLRPCVLPLQVELRLLFGDESLSGESDDGFEVWDLDDGEVCPADLIEEALIMAIPLVAMHDDDAACISVPVSDEKVQRMATPFASLKARLESEN
jgi:uncharacterized metal-binding protein YceD (DUF177 family)